MPSTGTTVEISAAVSAVTGAAAGSVWRWGARMLHTIRNHLQPDHGALFDASWALYVATSISARIMVRVACAPNRSLGRSEIDPDLAVRFVAEAFPGIYSDRPAFSSSITGVRFDAARGSEDGFIWVWKSGRVDVAWYLPRDPSELGGPNVDVMELLVPVALLARAVSGRTYKQLFGHAFRGHRRRLDWFIGVTSGVTDGVHGNQPWREAVFPGRSPARAGSEQIAFCPANGFAADALRNWNPHRGVVGALRPFLEDFLKVNGYHDLSGAVSDTLKEFKTSKLNTPGYVFSGDQRVPEYEENGLSSAPQAEAEGRPSLT